MSAATVTRPVATTAGPSQDAGIAAFVERCGIAMESVGTTRMAGRLLGWLLVCEPPTQSAEQVAAALRASSGGVSTAARQLVQLGFVERVGVAGDRRTHYRLRADAWTHSLRARRAALSSMRTVAEEGLDVVQPAPGVRAERLEAMRDVFSFLEDGLGDLMEAYPAAAKRSGR